MDTGRTAAKKARASVVCARAACNGDRDFGRVPPKLVEEIAGLPDEDAGVPEAPLGHHLGGADAIRFLDEAVRGEYVRGDRSPAVDIPVSRVRPSRDDADGDEAPVFASDIGGMHQRRTEPVLLRDRPVGVHAEHHGAAVGPPLDLDGGPRQRGGGPGRHGFREQIGARDIERRDRRCDRGHERLVGQHERALAGHEWLQTPQGIVQERLLSRERQELLGTFRSADGPEAGTDATGEDHGPSRRDVSWRRFPRSRAGMPANSAARA